MPVTAGFIDAMVEAFGKEAIHGQIRKGLAGEGTFYARENGHEVGTPIRQPGTVSVTWHPVTGCSMVEDNKGDK